MGEQFLLHHTQRSCEFWCICKKNFPSRRQASISYPGLSSHRQLSKIHKKNCQRSLYKIRRNAAVCRSRTARQDCRLAKGQPARVGGATAHMMHSHLGANVLFYSSYCPPIPPCQAISMATRPSRIVQNSKQNKILPK